MSDSKFCYGIWREEKKREPGFSHELISPDSRYIMDKTNLDDLDALQNPGVDTLLKCFKNNVRTMPNENWLGTRVGDHYEWMSFAECADIASNIAHGFVALDLVSEIEADG